METTMEALTLNEPDTADNVNSMSTDTLEPGPIPPPLSFIKEISFKYPFFGLNDFVMLPNDCGFVVTMAHRRSVVKFTADGKEVARHTYADFEPFGLCHLEDGNIVVSQPQTKQLFVLNDEDLSENYHFSLDKNYKSLSSDDGERLFCAFRELFVYFDILTKKNNPEGKYQIERCIKMPSGTPTCDIYRPRLMPWSKKIVVIQPAKIPKVACFSYDDEKIAFKYETDPKEEHTLVNPYDIAVSKDFIFIADKDAYKVTRIKHDGTFVDVMFPSEDREEMPPVKLYINKNGVLAVVLRNLRWPVAKLYSI